MTRFMERFTPQVTHPVERVMTRFNDGG